MKLGDCATKDMNASFNRILPLEITSSTINDDNDRKKIIIKNKIKRKGLSHRHTFALSNFLWINS